MKKYFFILSVLAALVACKGPKDNCATSFDQVAMLSNVGNNIISPRYDSLKQLVQSLSDAIADFNAGPSQQTLDSARAAYRNAVLIWQRAMIFEFGPAETHQMRRMLNNFPSNVTRLESAVQSGVYNLEIDSFSYTRGFPAIDYLLYGAAATDAAIIALYDTDANAANRRQLLGDIMTQIKTKVDLVHSEWATYKNTFNTTTGVATNTPVSLLVNQLNNNYELFKNNKLGNPIGAKVGYVANLSTLEARYSGLSLDLALASLYGMYEVFEGKGASGLDDYIAATGATKDGSPLQDVISNQFKTIISSLEAFRPATLESAIQSNFNAVKTAYAQAQNQVIYLKTDMPSVLCVSITYVDNTDDGD